MLSNKATLLPNTGSVSKAHDYLSVRINLKAIRSEYNGNNLAEQLTMAASHAKNPILNFVFSSFSDWLTTLSNSGKQEDAKVLARISSADDCSYTYHGCNGACPRGYGLVDVYCDGTSGRPDSQYCEEC